MSEVPPEIEFDRYLREEKRRHPDQLRHIVGRLHVEDLDPGHLYRYLVASTNRQFSNVGLNATFGKPLQRPLHFAIVEGDSGVGNAHKFEVGPYTAIVLEQKLIDSMWDLSVRFVNSNLDLPLFKWAPNRGLAGVKDIIHLLTLMQASIVTAHEFTHEVGEHGDPGPDKVLFRAEEIAADGFGLLLNLQCFMKEGLSELGWIFGLTGKDLRSAVLECFLGALMLAICSRWTRSPCPSAIPNNHYPPPALRLDYLMRIAEMWFREVGQLSTAWTTDGTTRRIFQRLIGLFPEEMRVSWQEELNWLESAESAEYRDEVEIVFQRLRKRPQ